MRLNSKDGRRKVERDEQTCVQVYINTFARYSYNTLQRIIQSSDDILYKCTTIWSDSTSGEWVIYDVIRCK